MSETDPSTHPVRLSVAGIGVSLLCSTAGLTERLAQRYRGYPGGEETALTAWLDISPSESTASLLDMPLDFENGLLSCKTPSCRMSIDPSTRHAELKMAASNPEEQADYFLRMALALLVYEAGGLLFHAAAVVRKADSLSRHAAAFFGTSGSGKSTVARLSAAGVVLNDDLVTMMPDNIGWSVHTTPFWNRGSLNTSTQSAALAGLFRLVQDRSVYLEPLSLPLAAAEMLASIPVVTSDPQRASVVIQRCQDILTKVPCFRLHFLPDASFWIVVNPALEDYARKLAELRPISSDSSS